MIYKKGIQALYGPKKEPVQVWEFWPEGSHVQAGAYYVVTFESGGERSRVNPSTLTFPES